jgi:hypothetical protein
MRKRDFLKKKVKLTGDPFIWKQYKPVQYFKVNLEANNKNPKSTWKLISNEINSRNASSHKTNLYPISKWVKEL